MKKQDFITTITGINTRGQDADMTVRTQNVPDRIYLSLIGDMNTNGNDTGRELPIATCERCGLPLNTDGETTDEREDPALCLLNETAEGTFGPHQPKPIPLAWANHVAILTDPDEDSIQVGISVADPRGGFFMTIRREIVGDMCPNHCSIKSHQVEGTNGESLDDWTTAWEIDGEACPVCEGHGSINRHYELRMSVPHHNDSPGHATLTELSSNGYYKIGS